MMVAQRPQIANGLHWLRNEIDASLARTRAALEQYVESPQDTQHLDAAVEELRLVRGTVGMIECFGAQTLADEMLAIMADLGAGRVGRTPEALAALSGATLQLSDYIDLLSHGEVDRALILQPLINELRLARGKPVVSEAELFAAQLRAQSGPAEPPAAGSDAAQTLARRELQAFQTSFLYWFRGQAVDAAMGRIGKIADGLAVNAVYPRLRELWSYAGALAECLRGELQQDSLELKRLFGRAGSQIKRLAEDGEAAADAQVGDLPEQLLFHLSRVARQTERSRALVAEQRLAELLPSHAALDELRRRLRGPNTSILSRVHAEIRRDFAQVKDGIDLAVRTGGRTPMDLAATRERLQRLASTFNALGLAAPQQALRNQATALQSAPSSPAAWMDLATAILRVEHSLEETLFRALGRHGEEAGRSYEQIEAGVPHAQDLRESVKALLRESLIDLARLKAGVDQYLRNGDAASMADTGPILHQVAAVLLVVERGRANALARRLESYARSGILADPQLPPAEFERFADAVCALEIYLEAVRDALPEPGQLLDELEAYVGRLDFGRVAEPIPAAPAAVPEVVVSVSLAALPEAAPPPATPAAQVPAIAEAPAAPPAAVAPPVPTPVSAPVGDGIDPEIRDIFIEEALEVLAEMQRLLPAFRRDPAERGNLAEVRRAFHTLKGSGRMAGALRIGEFGWSLESLLNRCLEGALPVRKPVVQAVDEAVGLLPGLIDNFRTGGAEDSAVQALVSRVEAIAAGPAGGEPDMLGVFREDARERLALVRRWLESQNPREDGFVVDPEVIRAFHTLRGSAAVINADGVSQLAGAFETYLNGLHAERRPLPPQGLALFADALVTLLGWIDSSGVVDAGQAELPGWLARIAALQGRPAAEPAPPAADDAFCLLALDLLQAAERKSGEWSGQPQAANADGAAAASLAEAFAELAAAAGPAHAVKIAAPARALAAQLAPWRGGQAPEPAFFGELAQIVEGLYQELDAYRDGSVQAAGVDWSARAAALPLPAAAPVSPPAAVPAVPPAVTPEAAPEEAAVMAAEAAAPEPTPAHLAATIPTPVAPEAPAVPVAEAAGAQAELAAPPESAPEPAAAPGPSFEAELAAIFADEAGDLIEEMERYLHVWRLQPDDARIADDLRMRLHTLVGSARTAGAGAIAAVAQRLQQAFEQPPEQRLASPALQAGLSLGLDELHGLVFELRRGQRIEADARAAIEALATAAAPEMVPAETGAGLVPAVAEPSAESAVEATAGIPEPEPPAAAEAVAPESAPAAEAAVAAPAEPAPAAPAELPPAAVQEETAAATPPAAPGPAVALDDELTSIFAAEAGELLEQLDGGFEAWQNGDATEPVRDVQRALHTLKGGARMASLDAMADLAHALESRVDAVLASGDFPDSATFGQMRRNLEQLQSMHDQVRRGEAQLLVSSAAAPAEAAPAAAAAAPVSPWSPELFWRPPDEAGALAAGRRETSRVPVETLDAMLNEAGEISIYRSRLEERNANLRTQLSEMTQTIARVREQLRNMDIETDAQISARGRSRDAGSPDRYAQDFDPLELDRYTRMQELSRALAESIGDLASLHASMDEAVSEADTLLLQQSRITSEVQQTLMGTLMVPFSRQVQRLIRVVRQTAQECGKQADVEFQGVDAELDRKVLDRITAPLEHLLRNAVVHGVEDPAARAMAGKPVVGAINVRLTREGGQLLVEVADDGRGLDFGAIRAKAVERGLMVPEAQLGDDDLARFIFEPGFSTARQLTQDAGRGIGMDVVASEVKQLAGTLELRSQPGQGTRFVLRLPLTLAVSQALLVGVGQDIYAVPVPSIEGVARIPRTELEDYMRPDAPLFAYGGRGYRVRHLGEFLGQAYAPEAGARSITVMLVRLAEGLGAGERRMALIVDTLIGNREIVTKSAGPQVSSVPGVAGATILADGRVVLILDVPALIAERSRRALLAEAAGRQDKAAAADVRQTVFVVDDSITMRRVAERLLTRNGYRVITAKDGLDAIAMLQSETPDTVLLDIEMPRADGFEVAAFIRNNPRLRGVPIIMITSRSGDKHRERARALGVDRYLIKPYQEDQLLAEVKAFGASKSQ
ncbi:MAG: Hpt domain-containing protein [Nevskia sp.]|nr:Hpt domain-containing protein [Nevskia sp.]